MWYIRTFDILHIMAIHKPGIKKSNVPFGNPNNPLTNSLLSDSILITTEIYSNKLQQPMSFGPGEYRLIMKWIVGKIFVTTKLVNEKDELIYYYIDIGSPVKRSGENFEFTDWYLDIIKRPNEKPFLDDVDEFEDALKSGFLTQDEATVAQDTSQKIMQMLEKESFEF